MSPRSREFRDAADESLRGARAALAGDAPARAASAAYYAMLYGARAALSEEDRNAKTHSGTWHLFYETFVASGRFDGALHASAQDAQSIREAGDYEARPPSGEEAEAIVALADRFLAEIDGLVE